MRLYGQRVFVEDLKSARQFYHEVLGLSIDWEDADAIGFDIGATLIIEAVGDTDEGDEGGTLVGRFVGCSLAVNDIEASYRSLVEKGVTFSGPPERQHWGGVLAYFRDPYGNVLTLLGE
ncbi:VOC family protein [Bosea caraganae]|uniref:VOC family protein n=1 Tax=Bosea caraganae TaxID=2763117 RepID=A0A370L3A8_9HYPH|nr:VOC family protein [Bosea caraganae]RDJ22907.1 VOC family protein [Bosea caraganae]RDJ28687.1 VOC family protein [Bosea caraganae]